MAGLEQGPNPSGSEGHTKDAELYPEDKGRPLDSFEQRSDSNQICSLSFLSVHMASP